MLQGVWNDKGDPHFLSCSASCTSYDQPISVELCKACLQSVGIMEGEHPGSPSKVPQSFPQSALEEQPGQPEASMKLSPAPEATPPSLRRGGMPSVNVSPPGLPHHSPYPSCPDISWGLFPHLLPWSCGYRQQGLGNTLSLSLISSSRACACLDLVRPPRGRTGRGRWGRDDGEGGSTGGCGSTRCGDLRSFKPGLP